MAGWSAAAPRVAGQPAAGADTTQRLQRGVQLVRAGQYAQAVRRLRPLFEADATRPAPEDGGTVAYWLGTAHAERGARGQALRVWRTGLSHLRGDTASYDYRLADAFLRTAARPPSAIGARRLGRTYLRLLRRLDTHPPTAAEEPVVRRHLREAAVVLPDALQARTGLTVDPLTLDVTVDRAPNAGAVLAGWWRQQDPLPATWANERIAEHLRRAVEARARFTHDGTMDDRGKVFIRLGAPRRDVSIGMEDNETASAIATDIRRNEFWTYPHVHPDAYYLFVEVDPHRYRLSPVNALFPPDMRTGLAGTSDRARRNALDYLYTMEDVLRELGTFHGDYGQLAADVFDRAAWARDNAQHGIGSDPIEGPVGDYLQGKESELRNQDRKHAERRAQRVPASHTSVAEGVPGLPVAAQAARFLTPDGRTRVEVDWSLPTAALSLTDEQARPLRDAAGWTETPSQFAVQATAVRERSGHAKAEVRRRQHVVQPSSTDGAIVAPQTVALTTEDSLFHVALQWDQRALRREGRGAQRVSPVLRRHTARRDSLTALRSDPSVLEMSDLKLLAAPDGRDRATPTPGNAVPYPFDRVHATQPLALAFEVYHLAYAADDRTRYTVAYSTRWTADAGGLAGLFGGDEQKETATATTYRGDRRRTEEFIVLDIQDLVEETVQNFTVTVRVTDRVTGQQVARETAFQVVVPDESP
jgi:GWxTD domain-containing protein